MTSNLLEVRMRCLDEASARKVMDQVNEVPKQRLGGNGARREGSVIVITYDNKMWPYDIADMAGELGLASDCDTARVFACL